MKTNLKDARVYFTTELEQKLDRLTMYFMVKRNKKTKSQIFREALEDYYEKHKGEIDKIMGI